jgi:fructose-1-phosphate kinase PfkB-like protein
MTVEELIKYLQTVENQKMEVVIKTGKNNGLNFVTRPGTWSAKLATASHHTCDMLWTDNYNKHETDVLIIQ